MGKKSTPTRLKRINPAEPKVPPDTVSSPSDADVAATAEIIEQPSLSANEEGNSEAFTNGIDQSPAPEEKSVVAEEANQQAEPATRAELEVHAVKELFARIGESSSEQVESLAGHGNGNGNAQPHSTGEYAALLAYHKGLADSTSSEDPTTVEEDAERKPPIDENGIPAKVQSDTQQQGSEPVNSKSESEVPIEIVESHALESIPPVANAETVEAMEPIDTEEITSETVLALDESRAEAVAEPAEAIAEPAEAVAEPAEGLAKAAAATTVAEPEVAAGTSVETEPTVENKVEAPPTSGSDPIDHVEQVDEPVEQSAPVVPAIKPREGNAFDKLRKRSHTADMPALPKYEETLARASRKADIDHDNFDPPDDGNVQRITGSDITPLPKTLTGDDLAPLPSHPGEPSLHQTEPADGLATPKKTASSEEAKALQAAKQAAQAEKSETSAAAAAKKSTASDQPQKVSPFAATQVDGIKPLIEPHKKTSGAGKRTSSEGQPPLVNPFDAHKSGFLDALRKASRNNQTDTSSSTNVAQAKKNKQSSGAKADSGVWKPTEHEEFYQGPSRARGGDTVQMPSRDKLMPPQPPEDKQPPFKGRGQDQGPIQRWGHESEFSKAHSVWAEQLGVVKAAPPARASSSSVARNLRRIMSTGIFNVRELYSLRGIACLCVFIAQAQMFAGHSEPTMPLATIGAQLFFVLSGFFITRTMMVRETGSLKQDLGNFYAHRAMRIMPPYFITLAALLAWNHLPFAESFFSCLFNYKLFELNHSAGAISQYWTLCIEVQFYLLFPLLLLGTPNRMRMTMLTCLTFLSVLATYTSAHTRAGSPDYLLLPICGQFLMIGALAGYIDSKSEIALRISGTKFFLAGLFMQGGLQAYEVWSHAKLGYWPEVLWKDHATISAVSFALLIIGLWRTSSPVLRSLFTTEVLVYFGKISYGFYLMMPVAFILQPAISALDPRLAHVHPIAISFMLASVLAMVGWHYLQLPISNMRGHIPLRPDYH